MVIRQSCGRQLASVSLAAWVPSSLDRAQPVLPALPTHLAITQTVFGMALHDLALGKPALWLGLCLVTNGVCRAGDAPDSQRLFYLRRAHTMIVPVPDSMPLHTLLIFPGK